MAQNFDPNNSYQATNANPAGNPLPPTSNSGYQPISNQQPATAASPSYPDPNSSYDYPQEQISGGFQPAQAAQYDPNQYSQNPSTYNPAPSYPDTYNTTSSDGFSNNSFNPNLATVENPSLYNNSPQGYPQQTQAENTAYYDPNQQPQDFGNTQNYQYQDNNIGQNPQNYYQDPNLADPNLNDPNYAYQDTNTFVEKKTGNKFLMWFLIVLILALATASGVLFYLSRNQSTTTTDTASNSSQSSNSNNSSSISSSSSSSIATSQTPAQAAKIRNSITIPATWLSQKFSNNGVDATGVCTSQSICGDSADPDNDGLTNLDEYNYDTDPQNEDNDNDGISDGNEIYIYSTDPKLRDSDKDSVADLAELIVCTDPANSLTTKMDTKRLEQIVQNSELKPLKAITNKSLSANSATPSDLKNGYLQSACLAVSSSSSSTSSAATGPSISL